MNHVRDCLKVQGLQRKTKKHVQLVGVNRFGNEKLQPSIKKGSMKPTTPIAAAAQPGDSVRDLFIPDRWVGHGYPLKGSRFHHPKKVTKNCPEMFCRYFSLFLSTSSHDFTLLTPASNVFFFKVSDDGLLHVFSRLTKKKQGINKIT